MSATKHKPFIHETLPHDKQAIRLIKVESCLEFGLISCSLKTTTIDQAAYTALSYTWGPSEPMTEILLNSQRFLVRKNLWDFLNFARHYRYLKFWNDNAPDLVWVDAICIDQQNNTERNHQVRLMSEIYRCAKTTLMWLNPANRTQQFGCRSLDVEACSQSRVACDIMKQRNFKRQIDMIHSLINSELVTLSDLSKAIHFCNVLEEILEHEYWTRVWIVQEVTLSNEKALVFGGIRLPWREIWWLLIALNDGRSALTYREKAPSKATQPMMLSKAERGFGALRNLVFRYSTTYHLLNTSSNPYSAVDDGRRIDESIAQFDNRLRHLEKNIPSAVKFHIKFALRSPGLDAVHTFYKVILECMDTESMDPRDKVYGLAALAPRTLNFHANYALSTCGVFSDVYRQLCIPQSRFEESWYLKRVSVLLQTLGVGPLDLLYGHEQSNVQLIETLQGGTCNICGGVVTFERIKPHVTESLTPGVCLLICLGGNYTIEDILEDDAAPPLTPAPQHAAFYATEDACKIVLALEARHNVIGPAYSVSVPVSQEHQRITAHNHTNLTKTQATALAHFHYAWRMGRLRNEEDHDLMGDASTVRVGLRIPFKVWDSYGIRMRQPDSSLWNLPGAEIVDIVSKYLLPEMFVEPDAHSRFLEAVCKSRGDEGET